MGFIIFFILIGFVISWFIKRGPTNKTRKTYVKQISK